MAERSITHEGVKYRKLLRKAVLGDLITHRYRGENDGMPQEVVEIMPEIARFEPYYDYTVREEVTGFVHGAYMVLEKVNTGLLRMPKVGDMVRYLGGFEVFDFRLTEGAVYVVEGVDNVGDAYIVNSSGSKCYLLNGEESVNTFAHFELVAESVEFVPQPVVTDLIANLGRRLHDVETALAPKEYEEDGPSEVSAKPDVVNSPAHYKRGKLETIEVIEHITSGYDDPFVAYCVGNAVKYADRAPYKHESPAECLRKAAWYLTKAAEHTEASD